MKTMISKYHVEFAIRFKRHTVTHDYRTDDPVACEEFLVEILERGYEARAILHEGIPLPPAEFDGMLKTAALVLAANHLKGALKIDEAELRHRFGLPAGSRHLPIGRGPCCCSNAQREVATLRC